MDIFFLAVSTGKYIHSSMQPCKLGNKRQLKNINRVSTNEFTITDIVHSKETYPLIDITVGFVNSCRQRGHLSMSEGRSGTKF